MGFIDELESNVDMVELVGRYTRLKKAGVNYKALCPFPGHNEKTPSFVVSPVKQIGYCFGCHRGGGPVKFLMDMENTEFREAVQILGNITGQEIQGFTENKEKIEAKKNLYSLYRDATNYYKQALRNTPNVQKYLFDRGITQDDIDAFHFGYADSGINLYNYLREKGYDDTLIGASHIFVNVPARKDKFIGRIIFPIQNLRGDFVAFAGRIIDKGEPKYLNSPASDIYDKSSILYGLYDARKTIAEKDAIIITEGYMDTIALHRAGFTNTVAVSGTALTDKHIQIIKRLTHKIYLCFDSDGAGQKATKASLETLKNKGLEVKIIELDAGQDPDEFLQNGGNFEQKIENSLSPIAYYMKNSSYNLESIDEKKKFLSEVLEIIKSYGDPIEQDSYLKELSATSNTPVKILYEMLPRVSTRRTHPQEGISQQKTEEPSVELILLAYLQDNPTLADSYREAIIFPYGVSATFQQALENPENFLETLDIETRSHLQALSLKHDETTPEVQELDIRKHLQALNSTLYKKLSSEYKAKIDSGDRDALQKYTELLQVAKKQGIK